MIGDGAFPSGIVFEAMNNAGGLKKKLLVDSQRQQNVDLPARRRRGRLPRPAAHEPALHRAEARSRQGAQQGAVFGDPAERFLARSRRPSRPACTAACCSRSSASATSGPIDGHNIGQLRKYLKMVKDVDGPVLLHVVTEKGTASSRPRRSGVLPHAAAVPAARPTKPSSIKKSSSPSVHPRRQRRDLRRRCEHNPRVTVMTAAMCQGNKLEQVRDEFPDRFFDTGICESHAVAFAAGQAKAGLRPIVDIYSTFLQRSYDQIFQEVALQNLPVTFMLDRAGLDRARRADAPRRVRPRLHAAVPEHGGHGAGRRVGRGRRCSISRLAHDGPGFDPLSQRPPPRSIDRAAGARSNWARPKCSHWGTTA